MATHPRDPGSTVEQAAETPAEPGIEVSSVGNEFAIDLSSGRSQPTSGRPDGAVVTQVPLPSVAEFLPDDVWPGAAQQERALVCRPLEARSTRLLAATASAVKAGGAELIRSGLQDDLASLLGSTHAVALRSPAVALHMGLRALGVGPGDEVVVPTLSSGATAATVLHLGAQPVVLDCETTTWNLDPELLAAFLAKRNKARNLPAAVVTIDLFGRLCDYPSIVGITEGYGVPLLQDATAALGAGRPGRLAGSHGKVGILAPDVPAGLPGSAGGVLITSDDTVAADVHRWAREPDDSGYADLAHGDVVADQRMRPDAAALATMELAGLTDAVQHNRAINTSYRAVLAGLDGVEVVGGGRDSSNPRVHTICLTGPQAREHREQIGEALAALGYPTAPVWRPLHRRPAYETAETVLNGTADAIAATGLCLPSGRGITPGDVRAVGAVIAGVVAS